MAELFIPPWLRISATQPAFASNTAASESIFTGAARTTERAGDKVEVMLNIENASNRETDPNLALIKATRGALRGMGGRVWYTPVGYRAPSWSGELIPNNTFANSVTGWDVSAETSSSVADRVFRATRTAVTANQFAPIQNPAVVTTLYAPYVARFFVTAGRGAYPAGLTLWDNQIGARISSTYTNFGMLTGAHVGYSGAQARIGLLDESASGVLAGDYFNVHYASYSRCALVDNGLNSLLRSDEFDNAAWTKTNATISANIVTDPSGASGADALVDNGTNGVHQVSQSYACSSAGADFAIVGFAKANARNFCVLAMEENATTTAAAWFNVSTGVVGTTSVGAGWANARSFIASMGNGWYFCALVARKTSSATSINARIGAANVDGSTSYAGSSNTAIYIFRGASAPSSVPIRPVQTTSAAATGTSQTGSSLHLKGLPASTNGLLRYGDWVQSGKQLCMVTASLDSDAAGLGYLRLAYPPRTPPSDNDPIIVHEPFGRFYSKESAGGWSERPGGFADSSFTICEAFDS